MIRQLGTFNLLHSVFHEWKGMLKDFAVAPWRYKLAYLVREPGWSHDGSRDSSDTIHARWMERNGYLAPDEPQRMADEGIAVSHP